MKVTKLGHCCLIIEVGGKRLLTDPGNFTSGYDAVSEIDIVLITHEHADHLHIPALKQVLEQSPQAKVVANSAVGKLLQAESIPHELLEGLANTDCCGVKLTAHDAKHEEIYEDFGQVQNTGYFIAEQLFYPGDSFAVPPYHVPVLALPVAGPWCKVGDAVRYALQVKPDKAFPVHDGMLVEGRVGSVHAVPHKVLNESGIDFVPLGPGQSAEF